MRGHEEEDHLVDDVVVVDPAGGVRYLAQRREQVLARIRAARGEVAAEEVLEKTTTTRRAAPLGEGHRLVDAEPAVGGQHAVDKGLVHALELTGLGQFRAAHEHIGREIQRV